MLQKMCNSAPWGYTFRCVAEFVVTPVVSNVTHITHTLLCFGSENAASMAPMQKRSKAWLYFMRKDENMAICNNCKVSILQRG